MLGVMGEPMKTACRSVGPLAGWGREYEVTMMDCVAFPRNNQRVSL